MQIEIRKFDPNYIKDQVELIWEVTDNWTHEYQTSLASITKSYTSDKFDPSTRFYAFEGEEMVGYVTSAIVDDNEKGKYATLRFPVVKNNDEDITNQLFVSAENRLKELGVSSIKSFAGSGMGNTIELAERFGFEQGSLNFKRSKANISDLKYSGKYDDVVEYDEEHHDSLRDLFVTVIYPSGFGGVILQNMLANKIRKDEMGPNKTSWKIINEGRRIDGFSSLTLSDRNPSQGNMPPFYFRDVATGLKTMDKLLSAHIAKLSDHGMNKIGTFLSKEIFAAEPLYNRLGFHFDSIYTYEKIL